MMNDDGGQVSGARAAEAGPKMLWAKTEIEFPQGNFSEKGRV